MFLISRVGICTNVCVDCEHVASLGASCLLLNRFNYKTTGQCGDIHVIMARQPKITHLGVLS